MCLKEQRQNVAASAPRKEVQVAKAPSAACKELQAEVDHARERVHELEAAEQVSLSICSTASLGASPSHFCADARVYLSSWLRACCLCSEVLLTAKGELLLSATHGLAGATDHAETPESGLTC